MGTVDDYEPEDRNRITISLATEAKVPESNVQLIIVAASVEITAIITVPEGATQDEIETNLAPSMSTSKAATAFLSAHRPRRRPWMTLAASSAASSVVSVASSCSS